MLSKLPNHISPAAYNAAPVADITAALVARRMVVLRAVNFILFNQIARLFFRERGRD